MGLHTVPALNSYHYASLDYYYKLFHLLYNTQLLEEGPVFLRTT